MSLRKFKAISARGFKFINRLNFTFLHLCKFDAALGFEQKFEIYMLTGNGRLLICANLSSQPKPRKSALSRQIICA